MDAIPCEFSAKQSGVGLTLPTFFTSSRLTRTSYGWVYRVWTVSYPYRFNYRLVNDEPFPVVVLRLSNPLQPDRKMDVDAYLDSGTQRSLFNGWRAMALGLDLLAGPS
jgi:hypothetical protein